MALPRQATLVENINQNLLVLALPGRLDERANFLRDTPLTADDLAHIVRCDPELQGDRVAGSDTKCVTMYESNSFTLTVSIAYRTPAFFRSARTVSVGWAPFAIHCWAFSASTLISTGVVSGL